MSVEKQDDVIHSHQLNYKPVQEANCKYRFLRVALNNISGGSIDISPSVGQMLEWKLPTCVYNLSESFIGFTETVAGAAGRYVFTQEDTFGLATNMYFGNSSGLDLANVNYCNKYIKIARKINTKMNDFLTLDPETSCLNPSNSTTTANLYPVNNQSSTAPTDLTTASYTGVTNYIEPQYLYASPAANTQFKRNRLFKLGSVPDTIFSVDKDLYIPSDMYLRLTMGPANQYAFTCTSNTDLATAAASIAANINLTNVFLYVAVETNELIVQSLMSKVKNGGLSLSIPYTVAFRNATAVGSTVANINLPLNSQYGKKLSKVLTTCFNGNETTNGGGDCGNRNGSKIISYNTFLQNRQLQDVSINTTDITPNYADWKENRRHCLGSVIQNRAIYAQNWFHLDKFYEDNKGTVIPKENLQDGISMSDGPILHQFQATLGVDAARLTAGLVYYQFATFCRDVRLDNTGFNYV